MSFKPELCCTGFPLHACSILMEDAILLPSLMFDFCFAVTFCRFRECDDMLSRRLGGNIPAPLRKKKDETYKRFITPTGDPMTYVKQHMRYAWMNVCTSN